MGYNLNGQWREPPFARLMEEQRAQRAAEPPALARPVLVTVNGEFVAIHEDFTVTLSPNDPNWRPNVPGWCFFKAKGRSDE